MKSVTMTLFSLFFCLLFVVPAHGQSVSGALVGTVKDAGAAPVVGAAVVARHVATGATRTTMTDERGDFTLSGLNGGEYVLTVNARGFRKSETSNITLITGDRLALDVIQLEVGATGNAILNDYSKVIISNNIRGQRAADANRPLGDFFGEYSRARDPRVIQLGIKINF
ncbi:MAG: carboxypeptidase-like regulatory domain-containing protein [Blastocatellia bacterium]